MSQVTNLHPVRITAEPGNPQTVYNTGGALYYGDNSQVSSSSNQGSIADGSSATFTVPKWIISASESLVRQAPAAYSESGEVAGANSVATAAIQDAAVTNAKVASDAGVTWGKMDQTKFGAFSATPASQPTAYTQTYSTATRTHSNPTAASVATTAATNTSPYGYSQAQADAIVTAVNALVVDVANVKGVVNSVVDDLQTFGLGH